MWLKLLNNECKTSKHSIETLVSSTDPIEKKTGLTIMKTGMYNNGSEIN